MVKNNDKYKNYSREELIDELETLKKKKYGLVWDKKNSQEILDAFVNWENVPENFVPKQFPVLKEVKNKEIETDKAKPANLLLEGDNYHSLAVLNFTHQNKIDVIYIDPPYNTGNNDFIYNDKFVDKEDPFRHSKWLSFMEKRLRLAHRLLKNTGVIFISIDDNEQAQLKLLCDEIFGEDNFINTIALRVSPPNGVKITHAKKTIIKEKEYLIVYARDKNKVSFIPQFKKADKWDKHFDKFIVKDDDNISKWKIIPLSDKLKELGLKADLEDDSFIEWARENSDNIFQSVGLAKIRDIQKYASEKIMPIDGMSNYYAYKGRQVQLLSNSLKQTDDGDTLSRLLCDLWTDISFNNLFQEGGVDFRFGKKPVSLIKRLVKLSTDNKNALVLDFFAGSGTTGHSVLELNKEDDGNRKFILCTNDENGISSDICYPRLQNVIKGYKNKTGLGGNLKYFKTDFVGSDSTDKNKRDLVNKSAEMICIKEDIFDLVVDGGLDYKIYQKGKKFLGVIFDIDAIANFKKEAEKHKGNFVVYCFSYTEATPEKEFKGLKNKYVLKPIPAVILRIYLEIFKK
jgi:adenine-specific DNA-methyltransferase